MGLREKEGVDRPRVKKLVRAAGPWAKLGWLLGSFSPYFSSLTEKKEGEKERRAKVRERIGHRVWRRLERKL